MSNRESTLKTASKQQSDEAKASDRDEYLNNSVAGRFLMRELSLPAEALLQGPEPYGDKA